MRSTDFRFRRTAIAAAIALASAGVTHAATLVVRASGPNSAAYAPGKMLPDSARIQLKANDELVLLDAKGTRILRGPGVFSPTASSAAQASTGTVLAALVDQRSDRRVRIGAVRGVEGTAARSPNVWYVDASRGGTVCVADARQAMVWRPGADTAGTTMIAGPSGTATLDWSAGQAVQPWPQALPLADGGQYRMTTGSGAPATIKVAVVAPQPTELQDIAQTLIGHNCSAQLDLLVATTSAVETATK